MNLIDYYNSDKLNYRFSFYFKPIIFVVIVLFIACQPLTKPLVNDEKQIKISRLMQQDEAKDIVAKYVDRNWAANPYLMCQVNHLTSSDYRTSHTEFNVKGYISYSDMVLYPAIGRDECLNVRANQMDVLELENLKRTYYFQKLICCNINEERDKLVRALISLGARVGN